MPEQILLDFDVCAEGAKKCRVRVPERMPSNPLDAYPEEPVRRSIRAFILALAVPSGAANRYSVDRSAVHTRMGPLRNKIGVLPASGRRIRDGGSRTAR